MYATTPSCELASKNEVFLMRVKLLIASLDTDYVEHLSEVIARHYADFIDVSVCKTKEHLQDLLTTRKFDACLICSGLFDIKELQQTDLSLLLVSEDDAGTELPEEIIKVQKYQRISSIVANILEHCAKYSKKCGDLSAEKANITAVWSPIGGVGKTSVALAYAARKITDGKQVLYLNLETFSSAPAYFAEADKGISAVFNMLESDEGNVKMLVRSIRKQDSGSGVAYFCRPDNFDDMYALSTENISELVTSCAEVTDELVIDMSCICDRRARQVFDLADKILLVTAPTATAQVKLAQFASQHNVFKRIRNKSTLVLNKGANPCDAPLTDEIISLPLVSSSDSSVVYKTLSDCCFA